MGQFFGHLWGATTRPLPPGEPSKTVIDSNVEQHEGEVDGKKVVLRRTTIDEVEIRED